MDDMWCYNMTLTIRMRLFVHDPVFIGLLL